MVAVGFLQIFEHAPFFSSLQNLSFIPGAVLYAYIHAAAVVWAIFTLDKVNQNSLQPPEAARVRLNGLRASGALGLDYRSKAVRPAVVWSFWGTLAFSLSYSS